VFDVLSPDGIAITPDRVYETLEEAHAAAEAFAQRFAWQGFYSTARRERIPLEQIAGRCRVIDAEEVCDEENA
jgi:hypothetical protein